jgi:hypothetical protein
VQGNNHCRFRAGNPFMSATRSIVHPGANISARPASNEPCAPPVSAFAIAKLLLPSHGCKFHERSLFRKNRIIGTQTREAMTENIPKNYVIRSGVAATNDSGMGKAAEGSRSPGRWRVSRRLPKCAKRPGVRRSSGALAEDGDVTALRLRIFWMMTQDSCSAPTLGLRDGIPLGFGNGARLCLQDQSQRVNG